jgi:hypothetical protein
VAGQDSLPPWEGGLTFSLGQPARITYHLGAGLGLDWRQGRTVGPVGMLVVGVDRAVGDPVVGLLSGTAEMYAGSRSDQAVGGLRALIQIPALGLWLGGDYNLADDRVGGFVGASLAIRRGGLFGGGTLLRAEWNPGALAALRMSVLLPLGQLHPGGTRPRNNVVQVELRADHPASPAVDVPGLEDALALVDDRARRLAELVVPDIDRPGADPRAALARLVAAVRGSDTVSGRGLRVEAVVESYHAALVRAFSVAAAGGPTDSGTVEGELVAAYARRALLQHVLYPYDHLLGQWKTESTLSGLGAYARGDFAQNIVSATALPPEREAALLHVFDRLVTVVADLERVERHQWRDSRLVWLPLQLALRPADHDTQAELDAIIERVAGREFTDGNRVWYLINAQFQAEAIRSIEQAQDYHLLWVHDFRGRNSAGGPDTLSLRYVVGAYLRALARHAAAYDERRRLPVFMIFIDEHYYEANADGIWLNLLARPLDERRLPTGFKGVTDEIRAAQRALRSAVAGSRLLQAEARQYGDAWLRNMVKVHINVTNPADHSFRSRQILPLIGFPDDLMRDHRKIVLYDVAEDDPYRGFAIYTGMGIGEQYTGPTWEDRALMVQGPATLSLKTQARRLLESQGVPPERIPYPLRERPVSPRYAEAAVAEAEGIRRAGGRSQRAVELHNQTGFGEKQVSVARVALYELMPRGSVVAEPDPLWGNSLYASLLTGSALRGCRVLLIAPSLAAAPSAGWPSMAMVHDLFARLIVLQQELGPEIDAAGGMLKTGIYNPGIGVEDAGARFAAAYRNARRTPFLRRLLPVNPLVDTLFVHLAEGLSARADSAPAIRPEPVIAKLHLKATFFASAQGWDSLVARPEMLPVLQAYLGQLLRPDPGTFDARSAAAALGEASERLDAGFRASLPEADRERVMYYLLVGSANADYRSMFMDGEASVLLSGWSGVVGLIDFSLIASLSVWIDDLGMLDALLPPPTDFQRAAARRLRPAL